MQTRGEVFLLSHAGREQLLKEQRSCCGRRRGEHLEIVAHQVLMVFLCYSVGLASTPLPGHDIVVTAVTGLAISEERHPYSSMLF